jgi:hypothetical protein
VPGNRRFSLGQRQFWSNLERSKVQNVKWSKQSAFCRQQKKEVRNCCKGVEIWCWTYDGSFILKLGQLQKNYTAWGQNSLQIRYFYYDRGEPQETLVQLAGRRTFPMILSISSLFNCNFSQDIWRKLWPYSAVKNYIFIIKTSQFTQFRETQDSLSGLRIKHSKAVLLVKLCAFIAKADGAYSHLYIRILT